MASNWANLPAFVLSLVLDKLEEQIDHVWFGVVCKNWCSVAKLNHQSHEFRSKVLPMLMIPTRIKSVVEESCLHGMREGEESWLYGIATNRIYRFGLPVYYQRFCGSSHGWLATLDHYNMITLHNPFKNVPRICLPPLTPYFERNPNISKVILSADPITSLDDYAVVVIYGLGDYLAFIKVGKECWTYMDDEIMFFSDIIFYQGLVFAVGMWGHCVSFKPCYLNDPLGLETIRPTNFLSFTEVGFKSKRLYLVKSLEGDLWMVSRLAFNFISIDTVSFEVYKLKLDSHGELLEKIILESLGDNVLFLGNNESMSVSASSFSGCLQKDSIYFVDDFKDEPDPYPNGPFGFSIYNVKDQSFTKHCPYHPSYIGGQHPIWILPPFQWDSSIQLQE